MEAERNEKRKVKVAVRTIFHMPITPPLYVIDMEWDTWREFLYATPMRRKQIVMHLVGKDDQLHRVREVAWIPLDNQQELIVAS